MKNLNKLSNSITASSKSINSFSFSNISDPVKEIISRIDLYSKNKSSNSLIESTLLTLGRNIGSITKNNAIPNDIFLKFIKDLDSKFSDIKDEQVISKIGMSLISIYENSLLDRESILELMNFSNKYGNTIYKNSRGKYNISSATCSKNQIIPIDILSSNEFDFGYIIGLPLNNTILNDDKNKEIIISYFSNPDVLNYCSDIIIGSSSSYKGRGSRFSEAAIFLKDISELEWGKEVIDKIDISLRKKIDLLRESGNLDMSNIINVSTSLIGAMDVDFSDNPAIKKIIIEGETDISERARLRENNYKPLFNLFRECINTYAPKILKATGDFSIKLKDHGEFLDDSVLENCIDIDEKYGSNNDVYFYSAGEDINYSGKSKKIIQYIKERILNDIDDRRTDNSIEFVLNSVGVDDFRKDYRLRMYVMRNLSSYSIRSCVEGAILPIINEYFSDIDKRNSEMDDFFRLSLAYLLKSGSVNFDLNDETIDFIKNDKFIKDTIPFSRTFNRELIQAIGNKIDIALFMNETGNNSILMSDFIESQRKQIGSIIRLKDALGLNIKNTILTANIINLSREEILALGVLFGEDKAIMQDSKDFTIDTIIPVVSNNIGNLKLKYIDYSRDGINELSDDEIISYMKREGIYSNNVLDYLALIGDESRRLSIAQNVGNFFINSRALGFGSAKFTATEYDRIISQFFIRYPNIVLGEDIIFSRQGDFIAVTNSNKGNKEFIKNINLSSLVYDMNLQTDSSYLKSIYNQFVYSLQTDNDTLLKVMNPLFENASEISTSMFLEDYDGSDGQIRWNNCAKKCAERLLFIGKDNPKMFRNKSGPNYFNLLTIGMKIFNQIRYTGNSLDESGLLILKTVIDIPLRHIEEGKNIFTSLKLVRNLMKEWVNNDILSNGVRKDYTERIESFLEKNKDIAITSIFREIFPDNIEDSELWINSKILTNSLKFVKVDKDLIKRLSSINNNIIDDFKDAFDKRGQIKASKIVKSMPIAIAEKFYDDGFSSKIIDILDNDDISREIGKNYIMQLEIKSNVFSVKDSIFENKSVNIDTIKYKTGYQEDMNVIHKSGNKIDISDFDTMSSTIGDIIYDIASTAGIDFDIDFIFNLLLGEERKGMNKFSKDSRVGDIQTLSSSVLKESIKYIFLKESDDFLDSLTFTFFNGNQSLLSGRRSILRKTPNFKIIQRIFQKKLLMQTIGVGLMNSKDVADSDLIIGENFENLDDYLKDLSKKIIKESLSKNLTGGEKMFIVGSLTGGKNEYNF